MNEIRMIESDVAIIGAGMSACRPPLTSIRALV
jgi:succinate dehydrogenase/fumarate reductase flavoprotein subunit